MKKIKATFIGLNMSYGYEKNCTYQLMFEQTPSGKITIKRDSGKGYCIYDNMNKFLDNWKNISSI